MTAAPTPWTVLGLGATSDITAIRRAYAARLKAIDPETDPAAFIALREARDVALMIARQSAEIDAEDGIAPEAEPTAFADDVSFRQSEPIAAPIAPVEPPASPIEEPTGEQAGYAPDFDAIQRLQGLLSDPVFHSTDEIVAAARAVLDDPAMLGIDHAVNVENFITRLIYETTPRSDVLLEITTAHFRWDDTTDLYERPPIIQWILKRREDRVFEVGLEYQNPAYDRLLLRLRQAPAKGAARFVALRDAVRVEYLLAWLESLHPTTLDGLHPDTVAWWRHRIADQHAARPPIRWLHDARRRAVWDRGMDAVHQEDRKWLLYLGVLVLPYLFVWFLLRRGHSGTARVIGLAYTMIVLISIGVGDRPAGTPNASQQEKPVAGVLGDTRYEDFERDVAPIVASATGDTVDMAALRKNSAVYDTLQDLWRKAARDKTPFIAFTEQVFGSIEDHFKRALRGSDGALIADHARSYSNQLRWVARDDMRRCADVIAGRQPLSAAPQFQDYNLILVGRALLKPPQPAAPKSSGKFRLIPPIFEAARKRADMSAEAFSDGLNDRGPMTQRCNARIALLDALTIAPNKAKLDVIRAMFAARE